MFPRWLSILAAIGGSVVISLGMALQKKGVPWLKWQGVKDHSYARLRAIWLTGFALNNLLAVFYFFALKALSSAVVGAMMGLNIVFSAFFSALLLKETLSKRMIAGSLALVGFIGLANISAPPYEGSAPPAIGVIALFFLAPYALAVAAMWAKRFLRLHAEAYALAFAAAAGALEGFIIILIKAMQASAGASLSSYLRTPYPYMYAAATVSVLSLLQIAYAHGRMTKTGPALWGMQIFYPVAISYAAFAVPLVPAQLASFAGIVACVVLIQSKR
jgi:drug/metabolite transporter (DMT)-like permease